MTACALKPRDKRELESCRGEGRDGKHGKDGMHLGGPRSRSRRASVPKPEGLESASLGSPAQQCPDASAVTPSRGPAVLCRGPTDRELMSGRRSELLRPWSLVAQRQVTGTNASVDEVALLVWFPPRRLPSVCSLCSRFGVRWGVRGTSRHCGPRTHSYSWKPPLETDALVAALERTQGVSPRSSSRVVGD